ncbi:Molybdopterin biosynthesis MoaE [Patellaria atrata CBS 101060]|uniref:Molybdopterin synthase catalytic subunit n=1 Tax=Patellaria atrata CBS 101060 TaxID=1346257 RepID=A0A9P4VR80_9PEZI|nr:Molybdopterin biosynthesis MoaE [Patellaria atrata CBS 101060]
MVIEEEHVHVELAHDPLDAKASMERVGSPKAGAIVLFAGTTRDNFANLAVKQLSYDAYPALALKTLLHIARDVKSKHSLTSISIIHRLGTVPVGEESILIAVSSPHRQAAWKAGEEALELTKEKAEIWKLEEFEGDEESVWRANRDGQMGVRVDKANLNSLKEEGSR